MYPLCNREHLIPVKPERLSWAKNSLDKTGGGGEFLVLTVPFEFVQQVFQLLPESPQKKKKKKKDGGNFLTAPVFLANC